MPPTSSANRQVKVLEAINVELPGGRLAISDVVVVDRTAAKRATNRLQARDVLLAVEIVSPSSKPMDRAIKPDLYAEAGIPWFWLCELEPTPYLNVHELRGDSYELTANIRQRTDLRKPFPLTVDPVSWLD